MDHVSMSSIDPREYVIVITLHVLDKLCLSDVTLCLSVFMLRTALEYPAAQTNCDSLEKLQTYKSLPWANDKFLLLHIMIAIYRNTLKHTGIYRWQNTNVSSSLW